MWTLIKGSFWFSLVLVLLPVFSSGSSDRLANAPPVNFTDAYSFVFGAYDYFSNFCTEKPETCEQGGKTFTALGYRAKEGARIAYEYLDTKFSSDPAALAAANAPLKHEEPADQRAEDAGKATTRLAALAEAAMTSAIGTAGALDQPMPGKPQPYRPPVMDKVVTGTVPAIDPADAAPAAAGFNLPLRVPVPLPRP